MTAEVVIDGCVGGGLSDWMVASHILPVVPREDDSRLRGWKFSYAIDG